MRHAMIVPIISLVLSGVAYAATPQDDFLTSNGLEGKSIEQIVGTIDQLPRTTPLSYKASVTGTELILMDGEQKYHYPLGDKFYLSIAPYQKTTHPCANHSLSGCTGEMPNTPFDVKISDSNGNVIVNEKMQSYHNGFIGVWLPRDVKGTIEVNYQGKRATAPITTYNDSNTCMTTLQLL